MKSLRLWGQSDQRRVAGGCAPEFFTLRTVKNRELRAFAKGLRLWFRCPSFWLRSLSERTTDLGVRQGSQSSFVHLLTLANVSVLHEDVHAAGLASFWQDVMH